MRGDVELGRLPEGGLPRLLGGGLLALLLPVRDRVDTVAEQRAGGLGLEPRLGERNVLGPAEPHRPRPPPDHVAEEPDPPLRALDLEPEPAAVAVAAGLAKALEAQNGKFLHTRPRIA